MEKHKLKVEASQKVTCNGIGKACRACIVGGSDGA